MFTRPQQVNELARFPGATLAPESKSSWDIAVATAAGTHHVLIDLPPDFPECAPRFHMSPLLSHASADGNGVINHSALSEWTAASKIAEVIEAVIHPIISSPPVARTPAPQPHFESPPQVDGCATQELAPKCEVTTEVCDVQPQGYAPTKEPIVLSAAAKAPIYEEPKSEMQPLIHSQMPEVVVSSQPSAATDYFDAKEWDSREPLRVEANVRRSRKGPTVEPLEIFCCDCNGVTTFLLWTCIFLTALLSELGSKTGAIVCGVFVGLFYVLYALEWMVVGCEIGPILGHWIQAEDLENALSEAPHFWYQTDYYYTFEARRHARSEIASTFYVNTLRHIGGFVYNAWRDLSPPMPDLSEFPVVMTEFGAKIEFGDAFTAQEFKRQKDAFNAATNDKSENINGRTTRFIQSEGMKIVHATVGQLKVDRHTKRERTQRVAVEIGKRPECLTLDCFLCASILGCSCCFRHWLKSKIGFLDYDFHRQVFAVPGNNEQIAGANYTELVANAVAYVRPKQRKMSWDRGFATRKVVYEMGAEKS